MLSTLSISLAVISLLLLIARIYYYKLSDRSNRVFATGFPFKYFVSIKILFPVPIRFNDGLQKRKNKRRANLLLYAFFLSLVVTYIAVYFSDKQL